VLYAALSSNSEQEVENKVMVNSKSLTDNVRVEYLEVNPANVNSVTEYTFPGKVIEWSHDTATVKVESSNPQVSIIVRVLSREKLLKSSMVIIKAESWAGGYDGGWYYKIDPASTNKELVVKYGKYNNYDIELFYNQNSKEMGIRLHYDFIKKALELKKFHGF